MKPIAFVSLLVFVAACVIRAGQHPRDFEPAHSASGVSASLSTAGMSITGELLEVRDTGLVILAPERVVLVRFGAITGATFRSTYATVANR